MHLYYLGLSDNIVLSIIAIKFQYQNRDISESESCDASHVFAKMAKSNIKFLPLEDGNSAARSHFGFPACDGKILESDRKKRQLVYSKLFLIKQLS